MCYKLIPFKGMDSIYLYDTLENVKNFLNQNKVEYCVEVWDASECTVNVNWIVIDINKKLKLFFSEKKLKLFKIYSTSSEAELENGIKPGMTIDEAKEIDLSLKYNEMDEIWESPNGYWLEDSLETKNIESISIYIKEIEKNSFDRYEW